MFTVGPVWVHPDVLKEMSHQMFSHRGKDYMDLHIEVIKKLKKFMQTGDDIYLSTSSSTGIMEASVRNCVEKNVLNLICGAFGTRFSEVCTSNGRIAKKVEVPWGKANTAEKLDEALAKSDAEAVTVVHNETSTGVMNPLKEIASVVKKYDVLFLVDVVSSMGGTEIDVDGLGIDVCFFGTQKCMGVPPGLTVVSVSEKALEKAKEIKDRGYYFDFWVMKKYSEKNNTPVTPPIPQMFALSKALDLMFEEGLDNRFKRHKKVAERVREGIKDLGFGVFPDEKYASPTLTCIDTKGVDPKSILQPMKEKGFTLASGYGKIKDQTFRIGNMGWITLEDVNELLENLEDVMKRIQ